jgi:hypothetical protein
MRMRLPPSITNGFVTTATVRIPSSFVDRALGPLLSKVYKDLKRAEIVAFWSEITPLERTTYL